MNIRLYPHTGLPKNGRLVSVEMMGKVLIHVHEKNSLCFIISCQKTLLARAIFKTPIPQSLFVLAWGPRRHIS